MEQENTKWEQSIHRLYQITPVSKYLALGLFITLPFIGGLVGYTLSVQESSEMPHHSLPAVHLSTDAETRNLEVQDKMMEDGLYMPDLTTMEESAIEEMPVTEEATIAEDQPVMSN